MKKTDDIFVQALEEVPDVQLRRPWTEHDDAILRKYRLKPYIDLGKALDRSPETVRKRLSLLGIGRGKK